MNPNVEKLIAALNAGMPTADEVAQAMHLAYESGVIDGNIAACDRMLRRLAPQCPHGKTVGECNACDIAGDIAFDAAREDRAFGRSR